MLLQFNQQLSLVFQTSKLSFWIFENSDSNIQTRSATTAYNEENSALSKIVYIKNQSWIIYFQQADRV